MAFELKAINLDTVSNPDLLGDALRAMDVELGLIRTTVNELVIDHTTQAEYNSSMRSTVVEVVTDLSGFCSSFDSMTDVIGSLGTVFSANMSQFHGNTHLSNVSDVISTAYTSNLTAGPAVLTNSTTVAGPAQLTASSVIQERVTEGA